MELLRRWLAARGEDALWESFDQRSVYRGFEYCADGRVLDITPSERGLYGRVRGRSRYPYQVYVQFLPLSASGPAARCTCTCPMGVNCKHAVAVIAECIDSLGTIPQSDLTPRTRLWLDALERASGSAEAAAPAEQLIYRLGWHAEGGLKVGVYKTRLRKDGGFGRLAPYQGDGTSGARFLRPVDKRLLRWLGMARPYPGGPLDPGCVRPVLEELAASERAWVEHYETGPLRLGPACQGAFEWVADDDGTQRLEVRLADAHQPVRAVPAQPLYYLDPATAEVGPLDTGLPEPVALAMARAPAITPAELAEVREPLARLGGDLPMPAVPEERQLEGVAPRPHLHLRILPVSADAYPDDFEDLPVAELGFDYQGVEVEASAPEETVTRLHDGQLWRIQRHLDTERSALETLRGLDLEPLRTASRGIVFTAQDSQWWVLVARDFPRLEAEGWRVSVDPAFPYRLVEPERWYAELDEDSGSGWFDLDLGVQVDGERIALLPVLLDLIRRSPEAMSQAYLDRIDSESALLVDVGEGRVLPMPAARLVPILRTLTELYDPQLEITDGELRLPALRAGLLPELDSEAAPLQWEGDTGLRELGRRLGSLGRVEPAAPPAGLQATLRDYQRQGVGWLQQLGGQQLGGVLADDMGLGKTVQLLAHLLLDKEAGRAERPSLVVAPTSLLFNWEREAARFAPGLRVLRLHGPGRHATVETIPEHDLVLTTYALVHRDVETLSRYEFHLCVLDEAQAVKNPRAKAAQAVRRLQARQRICLTGTPLENHLGELWSQFDFLLPGLLGDAKSFGRLFRRPIERRDDSARRDSLRARIQPFLLRRTKEAVAAELPAKTEIQQFAELEGGQRDLYETVRSAMQERVRKEVARRGLARSQVVVLDALLKLRQVCCDPRLLPMDSARSVKGSAKLELLLELLSDLRGEGRRVLLFSQFTSMLALIEQALAPLDLNYVKLTGSTRDRETPVRSFQAGEVDLFLISLKAGGTGLNLTAADVVIHYDPWWNPAVMRQASDRAHRIGQTQPVFVYHLLTRGTVEERIVALQERKAALGEALLGGAGGSTAALEMADVEALFEPLA